MKKRRVAVVLFLAAMILALAACGEFKEKEIYYNGESRPVSHVEEFLEDFIEDENPNMDFEVRIYEEVED